LVDFQNGLPQAFAPLRVSGARPRHRHGSFAPT
jgi:hypothetical protein